MYKMNKRNKEDKDIFETKPEKAISKITINAFMIGSLFVILTLIWTLDPHKFSLIIISQLVLAIPLLYVSSLAYTKLGYWKETRLWDRFGWFTNNIGNIFVLNVIGLIAATVYKNLAFVYFGLILFLMLIYSVINVIYKPRALKEKLFKFVFFLIILSIGGIIPLILSSI